MISVLLNVAPDGGQESRLQETPSELVERSIHENGPRDRLQTRIGDDPISRVLGGEGADVDVPDEATDEPDNQRKDRRRETRDRGPA